MALNIYLRREDVPQSLSFVEANDALFHLDWVAKRINTCSAVLAVMKDIDGAVSTNGLEMQDRFGSPLVPTLYLSTGTKTVVNIINHSSDCCISTIECGSNVLERVLQLHSGSILMPIMPSCIDFNIDVLLHFDGHTEHFSNSRAFVSKALKLMR